MKRRILSTLMALCLALSLLPTAAFAAGGDETPVEVMPVEVQPMEEPLVEETAGPTASGTNFFCKWYVDHHYRQCAGGRHRSEL